MKNIILFIFLSLMLQSCALVHRMDIEQGNIMTPDMLNRLHPGMARAQIVEMMGTPMLLNTFNDNRVDYIYTFKAGNGPFIANYVILSFSRDRLVNIRYCP